MGEKELPAVRRGRAADALGCQASQFFESQSKMSHIHPAKKCTKTTTATTAATTTTTGPSGTYSVKGK